MLPYSTMLIPKQKLRREEEPTKPTKIPNEPTLVKKLNTDKPKKNHKPITTPIQSAEAKREQANGASTNAPHTQGVTVKKQSSKTPLSKEFISDDESDLDDPHSRLDTFWAKIYKH